MGGGSIVQLLLDVPAGHIMDRYGYRLFLKVTTITFGLAAVCYMFGLTQFTFILSFIIGTFGWLFFGPGINAYALSHATKGNAGRFMSLKDVSGSIGVVLSSIALPFIFLLSPDNIGYIVFVLFVCSLIGLMFSPKDHERVHHTNMKIETHHHYIKRSFITETWRALRRLNPASGMLLLSSVAGATFYGAIWFVVPLVLSHQANNGWLGIGLGIFDFAVITLGFILGNIADRLNRRKLVFTGLLVFSVSAMLAGLDFGWLFLLFGFLATTGDEMASLSLWSWLHTLDKDHANDGAVSGVVNFFNDAGWAIGPIMAGVMYGVVGPSWTIVIAAAPIFIVWIVYQFVMHRHAPHSLPAHAIPAKPHRPRHRS